MADISAAGESYPKEQENNNGENIWVNMNESRNDNQSELLQTVKYLKEKLQNVKKDNERILKAQEVLNNFPLSKIHNQDAKIHKGSKSDVIEKWNFTDDKSITQGGQNSSESSDRSKQKKKFKPYEEIFVEFRKIMPPVFNGDIKAREEAEAWLSEMKKVFSDF